MVVQAADEGAHKGGSLLSTAQDCAVVLTSHLHALGEGFQTSGEDEGGHRVGQQLVKAVPALFRGQALQIGVFRQTDEQEPFGVKMLKETGQGQARAVDVQRPQRGIFIVGAFTQDLQVKFPDDFP